MNKLLDKIIKREAKIAVIGLGYVGLPLCKIIVKSGYSVVGVDLDENKIESLISNKSYMKHFSSDDVKSMMDNGFLPTSSFNHLEDADIILICVPTPLSINREPDLSYVESSGKNILKHLQKNQLIILESSTYPGTTDDILKTILESNGFEVNKDFYLAYSPEREDPGNKNFGTDSIPKVVGASSDIALELAVGFYSNILKKVIPVSSARTAEAVKITENVFRSVNIALVNELKIVFDKMDIDIWEVIDAASTKPFGFMPFYPGPGLGGHCIPIDPFYLSFKAKEYGVTTQFIELSGEINRAMPDYVCNKVTYALNKFCKKSVNDSKILILGLSYKPDIDDMRESPATEIANILNNLGAKLSHHDNFINEVPDVSSFGALAGSKSIQISKDNLENMDLVLICTNHKNVDYDLIAKYSKVTVDCRNAMNGYDVVGALVKA